jgi:hypothetical protein
LSAVEMMRRWSGCGASGWFLAAVLATGACGKATLSEGAQGHDGAGSIGGATGTNGGAGGFGGGAGAGGLGPGDSSDLPLCPEPFAVAGPCPTEGTVCARPPACRACIGGYKRVPFSALFLCACQSGSWYCPTPPASGTVVDCVVEQPIACTAAKDDYVDPACAQHTACTPE